VKKKIADELLRQTRENYDAFAESCSRTREYVWPEFEKLIGGSVKNGDRVLDIGCGNGRLYPFFEEIGADYTGVDNATNLIEIAQSKFFESNFVVGDCLNLPFKNESFDLAVSLAVLHHIPSREHRQKFFKETAQVLRPGGFLFVSVWDLRLSAMIREKNWKRTKIFLKTQIKIALGLEKLDFGDFFIPWQNKYQRYHHAFALGELRNLVESAGFAVEKSGAFAVGQKEANLYIIAKKLHN
jgi:SAM-dependent methyltransferase